MRRIAFKGDVIVFGVWALVVIALLDGAEAGPGGSANPSSLAIAEPTAIPTTVNLSSHVLSPAIAHTPRWNDNRLGDPAPRDPRRRRATAVTAGP